MKTLKEKLLSMRACSEAIEWAGTRSLEEAWQECERGDWMLWLAFKMRNKKGWSGIRQITLAKVKCARLVQHLMKDPRSLDALDKAEKFAYGKTTRAKLNIAAAAAADAAAYAADAAAYAAAAAAAAAAVYAAYVYAAGTYAIRSQTLKKCADICRETLKIGKL